jgi:hypothetical protein
MGSDLRHGGAPGRDGLRAHLTRARLAGDVATPRQSNLESIRRASERDPDYLFGLRPEGRWSFDDVFALMVERVGIRPDRRYRAGPDTIDPDRTLDRLDAMRARLEAAADGRQRVLVATGHPQGVHAVHAAIAAALERAGCEMVRPAGGASLDWGEGPRALDYLDGVAVVSGGGRACHTHSPEPMEAMLAALRRAGEPPPDLVVADHGYAGAAGEAGVESVGFADCNDPALFVGEAEGRLLVCVPLDDGLRANLYEPINAYLLAGLSR